MKDQRLKFNKRKNLNDKSNYTNPRVRFGTIQADHNDITYNNDYFGLSIKVPRAWIMMDYNTMYENAVDTLNKLNISEAEKNKLLEAMTTDSICLFKATPFPVGTKEPFGISKKLDNPIVNCMARRALHSSNTIDYMDRMIELMKNGSLGMDFDDICKEEPIILGGKQFEVIKCLASVNNSNCMVLSKYHTTLMKGYQLSIITTSTSEDGAKALEQIVNSLILV